MGVAKTIYKITDMKLRIKSWMGVAVWKWIANDTDCGICRLPFDGCCPDCRIPGDDCPLGREGQLG